MPPPKLVVTPQEIAPWLHVPLPYAARKIGVCTAILKRACRELGIKRWPYRKVTALNHDLQLRSHSRVTWRKEKIQVENDELLKLRQTVFGNVTRTSIDDLLFRNRPLSESGDTLLPPSPQSTDSGSDGPTQSTQTSVSSPPQTATLLSSQQMTPTLIPTPLPQAPFARSTTQSVLGGQPAPAPPPVHSVLDSSLLQTFMNFRQVVFSHMPNLIQPFPRWLPR